MLKSLKATLVLAAVALAFVAAPATSGAQATKTVTCTISTTSGQQANTALVTAVPTNPGRA